MPSRTTVILALLSEAPFLLCEAKGGRGGGGGGGGGRGYAGVGVYGGEGIYMVDFLIIERLVFERQTDLKEHLCDFFSKGGVDFALWVIIVVVVLFCLCFCEDMVDPIGGKEEDKENAREDGNRKNHNHFLFPKQKSFMIEILQPRAPTNATFALRTSPTPPGTTGPTGENAPKGTRSYCQN